MWYVRLTLLVLLLSGCASQQILFKNEHDVAIIVVGKPEVRNDGYEINLKFESPTEDSHLIQQIRMNPNTTSEWIGIESFTSPFNRLQVDCHSLLGGDRQFREILIMPGSIYGADETLFGFAMLPSGWPNAKLPDGNWSFNHNYRKKHEIRGKITSLRPEHAPKYYLNYENSKLTMIIEGGPVYVWDKDGIIVSVER